jgi:hypothetical protein
LLSNCCPNCSFALKIALQLLPELLLRDAIDPHGRVLADPLEGPSQRRLVHEVRQ